MSTTAGCSARTAAIIEKGSAVPLTEEHTRRVNAARACISEARTNIATVDQIGENSGRYSQGADATLGWARVALDRAVQCLDGLEETSITWELREWIREETAKLAALEEEPDREPEPTYSIVRFRKNGANEVMSTGHTLAEVQEHCGREDTHGPDWFDGFRAE